MQLSPNVMGNNVGMGREIDNKHTTAGHMVMISQEMDMATCNKVSNDFLFYF